MLFVLLPNCCCWWTLAGGEDEKPYACSYSPPALNKKAIAVSSKLDAPRDAPDFEAELFITEEMSLQMFG